MIHIHTYKYFLFCEHILTVFMPSKILLYVKGKFMKHNPLTPAVIYTKSRNFHTSQSNRSAEKCDLLTFLANDYETNCNEV